MMLSRERILTTHVGSLPRSAELTDFYVRQDKGEAIDQVAFAEAKDRAVRDVVARQAECGIDIANDGEQQRPGFQTYVSDRMTGFSGVSKRRRGREFEEFPELARMLMQRFPNVPRQQNAPEARDELTYTGTAEIAAEIGRLKAAAAAVGPFAALFATAPSPGIVASTMLNAHYDSHEAYLAAIAREMAHEYRAIHEAGLILQIDAPDLAMDRTMMFRDLSDDAFVEMCAAHVAAINAGITGIPPEAVRLHVCWGNWDGPHIHDIALARILPALLTARVGMLSIEFANPRHAHEYKSLAGNLPEHLVLLPGVIESTNNFVEHPEVVAGRLEQAVGDRERVIASTDCGFGSFANREWVVAPVVWLKLRALRDGADIASRRLWGRSAAA